MKAIRLIVNADDLGRTPEINAGIVKAFQDGIVTSASVMVNFPAFNNAVEEVLRNRIPVGVHLNLTDGRPLCKAELIPSLVNENGFFLGKTEFFIKVRSGRISPSDVRRELTAQVQQAAERLPIDHLDGHHHVHSVPFAAPVCDELAAAFGIPFIRYVSRPKFLLPLHAALQQWTQHAVIAKGRKPSACRVDHFWGYELWLAKDKEKALLKVIDRLRPGLNELMCHPGFLSSEAVGLQNRERAEELAALCSRPVMEKVTGRKIMLTNFFESADSA